METYSTGAGSATYQGPTSITIGSASVTGNKRCARYPRRNSITIFVPTV